MAINRVAARVLQKGHHVPDDIVQRRYTRGLKNFFELYVPIATSWQMLYNASKSGPMLVASGGQGDTTKIALPELWELIKTEAGHGEI
jgi:predicted ABC-type ATPase